MRAAGTTYERSGGSLSRRVVALSVLLSAVIAAGVCILTDWADDGVVHWMTVAAVSVGGAILVILLSGGYLARAASWPIRRPSAIADGAAFGDLAVRMPQTAGGEVGDLQRAVNKLTEALEASRDELRLASGRQAVVLETAWEQVALRRVAMLVARGVSPTALFGAVAAETGTVLDAETTALIRFEQDGQAIVAAIWDKPGTEGLALPPGSRWPTDGDSIAARVQRTGKPAWVTSNEWEGGKPDSARGHHIESSAASPIIVNGLLWGALVALSGRFPAAPGDPEKQLVAFAELVGMAIANTENMAQLVASRARVVAAADETRRRLEHELHNGTEQRLISLALELRAAESLVPPAHRGQVEQWSRTARSLIDAAEELRKISRDLHPKVLERGGLAPAVRSVARRAGVPVKINMQVDGRLPQPVEVAAYYVVSEALANAAKHAEASVIEIDLAMITDYLHLRVRDDGVGGADATRGSGLIGLMDRVAAVGGRMGINSPARGGTTVLVTLPLTPS